MIPRLRSDRTRETVAEAICPEMNCALPKKTLSEKHPQALQLTTPQAREQELLPTEEGSMPKKQHKSRREQILRSARQDLPRRDRQSKDRRQKDRWADLPEDLLREQLPKNRKTRSRSGSVSRRQTDRSLHGVLPPHLLMMKDRVVLS